MPDVVIPAVAYAVSEAVEILPLFHGREIDQDEFYRRTTEQFSELFEFYRHGPGPFLLQTQLEALLETRHENLPIILALGALALLAKLNAEAVLVRAREAPEEWIHFVSAQNGDMYIGAT